MSFSWHFMLPQHLDGMVQTSGMIKIFPPLIAINNKGLFYKNTKFSYKSAPNKQLL